MKKATVEIEVRLEDLLNPPDPDLFAAVMDAFDPTGEHPEVVASIVAAYGSAFFVKLRDELVRRYGEGIKCTVVGFRAERGDRAVKFYVEVIVGTKRVA